MGGGCPLRSEGAGGAPLQPQRLLCRQRGGPDPALLFPTFLLNGGPMGGGPQATERPLTLASQRLYRILHVAASAGEHEKVVQVTVPHPTPLGVAQEAPSLPCPCPRRRP